MEFLLNKIEKLSKRSWIEVFGLLICAVVALSGIGVLTGWYFHLRALVQILPGAIPMQYNTALCFVALGVSGLFFLSRRGHWLLPAGGGAFVAMMGAMVVFEYAAGTSLGIDTAFFYPWERALSANPGRMAVTSAISFLSTGSALVILTLRPRAHALFAIAHTVPLSLGLTSTLGYLFGVTYVLPFRFGSQMAIHTSLAFLAYAIGMLNHSWRQAPRNQEGLPKWLPAIPLVMLPLLFVGISQGSPGGSVLAWIVPLSIGLISAGLLALALYRLTQSRIAYKGLILISVPLIFVLAFVLLVVQMTRSNEQAQARYLHTKEVIAQADVILESLLEAETSVRGYVVTGDPAFTASYNEASKRATEGIKGLQALVRDNPAQETRAARLEGIAAAKLAHLAKQEHLVRTGDREGAIAEVRTKVGLHSMEEFRREMDAFLAEEHGLDAARRAIVEESWQRFNWLLVAGASVDISITLLFVFLFVRGISRPVSILTKNAQALAEGKALIKSLRGTDELAHLDQVFHVMARALSDSKEGLESRVAERTAELSQANALLTAEVAERQRAEAGLAEQRRFLRQVIDLNPSFVFAKDREGRFTLVNQSLAEAYGTTVEDLLGKRDADFNPDPEKTKLLRLDDLQVIDSGRQTFIPEESIIDAHGNVRWLQTIKRPLALNHGKTDQVLGVATDITDRKAAEDARKAGDERYRRLVEMSPETIAIHSEGVFRFINAAGAKLLGASDSSELIGKPILDIIHPDFRELVMARVQSLNGGTGTELSEQKVIRLDGQIVDVEVAGIPFTYEDKPAVQIIMRDVTSRKQAEIERRNLEEQLLQSQKLESIGTLAGGIAHDFNNLLTVISGNAQLGLARLQGDSPIRQRLIEVEKAADRAATLTRQLLAFSRRQQLARRSINLSDTIHEIMKLLRRLIGEDVEVRFSSSANLAPVFADPSQVEQVVMNLAVNARDAMPEGGQLLIETNNVTLDQTYLHNHPLATPGRYVEIKVSDTGTGMDEEIKARIFEPFFTTKATGKGTGLGLATVYGIVKQHDGLIEVYSEVGQGTTFKIYLPVAKHAIETEVQQEQEPVQNGNETILVAEDEEPLRNLTRSVLEALGYTVLLASNGEEAVDIYNTNRDQIDLVILDVVMPRMGGHEACEQIRMSGNVPVIFMTGYSVEMVRTRFLETAGVPLLQKPYKVDVLGRKVREVLDAAAV
jgi:PAS domain S-box-containing protein